MRRTIAHCTRMQWDSSKNDLRRWWASREHRVHYVLCFTDFYVYCGFTDIRPEDSLIHYESLSLMHSGKRALMRSVTILMILVCGQRLA